MTFLAEKLRFASASKYHSSGFLLGLSVVLESRKL